MLLGAYSPPAVTWPTDRVHRILAVDSNDPDIELEPLPVAPVRRRHVVSAPEAIVEFLRASDGTTLRTIAAGVSTWARPKELEAQGKIELNEEGWSAR